MQSILMLLKIYTLALLRYRYLLQEGPASVLELQSESYDCSLNNFHFTKYLSFDFEIIFNVRIVM